MSLNVELLEQSFELVKPQADELMSSFYNNLFTDYPASKQLFEHSDMSKQKQMLKGALVMTVENLRRPDVLSDALKGLGARHVKYGALPEHYPMVGQSLLKALAQHAGDAWTDELQEAWAGAYGVITELMLEGADYAPEEVALESAPAPTAEEGGLNIEVLEQSFALVAPQADDLVSTFYNYLFTDYPESKALFEHTDMSKQAQMLKGGLVMVVENLRKPDVLSKALKGLGARHVNYGALPAHYPLVGNSLLKALEKHAGAAWTAEVKDAWVDAYGAITELMLEGADYDQQDIQLDSAAAVLPEPPEGIGMGKVAGIIGAGSVAFIVLLIVFL